MSPTFDLSTVAGPAPERQMTWSPQQEDIFAAIEEGLHNLRVDAVAGAGKTTTLVESCRRMSGTVAFCAFNKRIADEIKERVSGFPNVKAGTFHAFGLAAWKKVAPKVEVSGDKVSAIIEDMDLPRWQQAFVGFMVSIAKQSGFGLDGEDLEAARWYAEADHHDAFEKLGEDPSDDTKVDAIAAAVKVLRASNEQSYEVIDFDDMLYSPLLAGIEIGQYDWVLIDEAQDTNTVRRELAFRMLRKGGRLVAVGDEHQAIYGFTGADADAMDLIEREFSCKRMPLTITYRCPKSVVKRAHEWVSHIQAAETAPEGITRIITNAELEKYTGAELDKYSVVLCRNTRPVVALALSCIRKQIPARVEGKEIGAGLVKLAFRWKSAKSLDQLRTRLDSYLDNEMRKLLDKGQKAKAAALEDRVQSLQAVIDSLKPDDSLYTLKSTIERLFGDSENGRATVLTLSTIHKAKGREWKRVYWLNPDLYQPSKWAKQEWEIQQEKNLCYVAVTRAKEELVEIRSS